MATLESDSKQQIALLESIKSSLITLTSKGMPAGDKKDDKFAKDEQAQEERTLFGKLVSSVEGLKTGLLGLGKGFMKSVKGVFEWITDFPKKFGMKFLFLAGALAGIVALWWDEIKENVLKIKDRLMVFFGEMWEGLKLLFTDPIAGIKKMFGAYEGMAAWLWAEYLKPMMLHLENLLGLEGITATLETWFQGFWNQIFGETGFFNTLWTGVTTLFSDPMKGLSMIFGAYKDMAEWFWNSTILPVWNWLKDMFPETFATIEGLWNSATDGISSLGSWLGGILTGVWTWIKGIFSFGDDTPESEDNTEGGFLNLIGGIISSAWTWIKNIFSFGEGDKSVAGDFSFVGLIKSAIDLVKLWFGDLFKFDSKSDMLTSAFNVVYFIPNMIIKGLMGVTQWFLKLFGFDEESADLKTFSEGFSIGKYIVQGLTAAFEWISGIFDWKAIQKFIGSAFGSVGGAAKKVWGWLTGGGDEEGGDGSAKKDTADAPPPGDILNILYTQDGRLATMVASLATIVTLLSPTAHGEIIAISSQARKFMTVSYGKGAVEQQGGAPADLSQLKSDEGFRSGVYEDTEGIKTVGYGFNLERAGAQEALDAAGIKKSLADLKSGKVEMTEEEADRIMRGEYPHFADAAKRFVGEETWKKLSGDRQKVLTNMAYNMGESGLNQFNNLRKAIQAGDWQEAGAQMLDSKWAKQVKGRSSRLAARMQSPAVPSQPGLSDGQELVESEAALSAAKGTGAAPPVNVINNTSMVQEGASQTTVTPSIVRRAGGPVSGNNTLLGWFGF